MSKLKVFAYGFVSCLLLILLYAGAQAMEEYEFQFGWPPFKHISVPQESEDYNHSEGKPEDFANDSVKIGYLDANTSWSKDSLDNHKETKGLFDELNKFQLEALKSRIDEKKLSSPNLYKVVDALQRNHDNGFDPHVGKKSNGGNYNSSSDKTINIDNYITWLSAQHVESVSEDYAKIKETPKTSTSKITGKSTTKATDKKKEPATEQSKKKDSAQSSSKKTDTSKKRGKRGED